MKHPDTELREAELFIENFDDTSVAVWISLKIDQQISQLKTLTQVLKMDITSSDPLLNATISKMKTNLDRSLHYFYTKTLGKDYLLAKFMDESNTNLKG